MCIRDSTDTKPLGGNVLTWQTVTPENDTEGDGRFRWILYDLDDSLGVGTDLALSLIHISLLLESSWLLSYPAQIPAV